MSKLITNQIPVINLLPQERPGNYDFNANPVCTRTFANEFPDYIGVISYVLEMIKHIENPDYLQVFTVNKTRCYAIAAYERDCTDIVESENHVTFMLASDY